MADEQQHTGVGVFLIPESSDPIVAASSEPAHLTTVWLGDMNDLDEDTIAAIRDEVTAYAGTLDGPVVVPTAERGLLGDEDADVQFLERTEALLALREGLLAASPTVRRVMDSVEQFSEWTPHVTLGYPETPAAGEYDGDAVTFDKVGLWVGPDQEDYPMSGKSESQLTAKGGWVHSESYPEGEELAAARDALAALAADASSNPVDDQSDLTEGEEVGTDDEMPMDELEEGEELITEIPVHGVATVEGRATGDGRGFRLEALDLGAMPQPLGYEYVSTHGGDTSNVAIVGRIDSYERKEIGDGVVELRWRGVIMPGKEYGAQAIESIVDGSYTGLSVIVDDVTIDVEEEKERFRASLRAERDLNLAPAAEGDGLSDEEIDARVDEFIGDGTQPVTWFSSARVRRFDMVPTGAFQEAYIALGHEFADELTDEQLTAAAQALEDCGCASELTPEDVIDLSTGQYVVEFSDESGTALYGPFGSREAADAWVGAAGDGVYQPISVNQALPTAEFREVSEEERKKLAEEGKALPDGSFPIANVDDLRNAIQAIGRAKDPEAAKAHIKKRARELGEEGLIPEGWSALLAAAFAPGTKDGPGWITHPVPTARIRRYWVRGKGAAKIGWGTPGDFNRCRAQLAKYVQNPEWLAGLCANMHKEAIGVWPGQEGGGRHGLREAEYQRLLASGLSPAEANGTVWPDPAPLVVVASASDRTIYPASAFAEPTDARPFPLRIDREAGTISGYAATWGSCHIGISGMCQQAPHSATDYSYFRKGVVDTDEGEQRVGLITAGIGHAGDKLSAATATAHYDQTGAVRAYINIGENAMGIWYAGVIAPGATSAQIDELRAIGRVSGDWRNWSGRRGDLEMVGLVAVNTEGFQLAASAGIQTAAIGIGALDADDPGQLAASATVEGEAILEAFDLEALGEVVANKIIEIQDRREIVAAAAPARAALAARNLAGARAKLAEIIKE